MQPNKILNRSSFFRILCPQLYSTVRITPPPPPPPPPTPPPPHPPHPPHPPPPISCLKIAVLTQCYYNIHTENNSFSLTLRSEVTITYHDDLIFIHRIYRILVSVMFFMVFYLKYQYCFIWWFVIQQTTNHCRQQCLFDGVTRVWRLMPQNILPNENSKKWKLIRCLTFFLISLIFCITFIISYFTMSCIFMKQCSNQVLCVLYP